MRRQLSTAGLLVALITLPSCSSDASSDSEVRVQVRRDVSSSDNPLGDVVVGEMEQGDKVTALCFVRRAQTNAGSVGSAIKVRTNDRTGYAAVSDFPEEPADRQAVFDLDEEALRDLLPPCQP
jgi:hypothetical protein